MDLFKYFRNNKRLDELIKELNNDLMGFGFEPLSELSTFSNSGFNDKDEWVKSTFKSDDGKLVIVTVTRNHTFNDESDDNEIKSSDIRFLENELDKAVESQNFEMAVKLRDRIKHLKSNEKVLEVFEKELEIAIKEQNFEKCIDLRDKIKNIKTR